MKLLGIILVVLGLAGGTFAFNMDTSVEAGGQTYGSGSYSFHVAATRVNNLGLMEERRNYLYMSGLAILAGIILVGFGSLQKPSAITGFFAPPIESEKTREDLKKCPHCAELIKRDANVCRYCGRDVPGVQAERRLPASDRPQITDSPAQTNASLTKCAACGNPIYGRAPFCGKCGRATTPSGQSA